MVQTKTRVTPSQTWTTKWFGSTIASGSLVGVQESIQTIGHNLRLLGKGDQGGTMILQRTGTTHGMGKLKRVDNAYTSGSDYMIRQVISGDTPSISDDSKSSLEHKGTTAIALTTPTQSAFDMATFIGESISGGMPAFAGHELWRERTRIARGAGSEYLNYEFGWLPLVNDVKSFAHAVRNSHQILSDLYQGSGKKTRVGYTFPAGGGWTDGSCDLMVNEGTNGPIVFRMTGSVQTELILQTWFKGCFTYYMPVNPSQMSKAEYFRTYADKILGISLTPESLWNMAPWSWAADWFGNTGSVLANISNFGHDNLVLQYGYIMNHKAQNEHYIAPAYNDGVSSLPTITRTRTTEYKTRYPATPYGFGFDMNGLSLKQSAILVALGLSH